MEQQAYRTAALQMIALVRCAVNGTVPDFSETGEPDPAALLAVCRSHDLTACTAYALEAAGRSDAAFREEKEKAVRKSILLDADRRQICARLEAERIWYLPLKGSLLKDWYPKLGMRQMSDNDILFDPAARTRVREIMTELGFSCSHFGSGNVDAYEKPPVSSFEMHISLYKPDEEPQFAAYFSRRTAEMLLPDSDGGYGRQLSPEDFYLYFISHACKHFRHGGTGVRTLLDVFVFLRKFEQELDFAYLDRELAALSLTEYERETRVLAQTVFSGKEPDAAQQRLLDYYIFSGTYGTVSHEAANRLQEFEGSKARYLFRRVFPPMDWIRRNYPFFYRHKALIPVLWVIRPIRGLLCRFPKLRAELRGLKQDGIQASPQSRHSEK